jgi:hypothetical protein
MLCDPVHAWAACGCATGKALPFTVAAMTRRTWGAAGR